MLWSAVEGWKGDHEKLKEFETSCVRLGLDERKKQIEDISNVFSISVEKEMELRK